MRSRSPLVMLAEGGTVDPYAAIRTLGPDLYQWYDGDWRHSEAGSEQLPGQYGYTQQAHDALWGSGFGSKYGDAPTLLSDGRVQIRMQQPGGHKYDTMDVVYRQGDDGRWVMDGDPTMRREVSSREQYRDAIEPAAAMLATVVGAGAAAGAYGGAGAAGAGGAAEAAAGAGGSTAGAGAGAGVGGGTGGWSATATNMAQTAGRNALINGALTEARGGDFMDGARAGALSGLAAPVGAGVTAATGSSVLGGAAAGAAGTVARNAASGNGTDFDDLLTGAASGGVGAGVSDALGGGAAGTIGGRTASGVVAGRDLDDALRAAILNPSSYRGAAGPAVTTSSGGPTMGDDDYLPETDDWDYGEGASTGVGGADGWDWGSREGGNYTDPGLTQGGGGSPWNASEDPGFWDQLVEGGGGALSSIGGWLNQLWQGNPQSRNQANWLLGLLGAYQAYRGNSGGGGGGALSPAQLQGMLPGANANSTWNAAQQAASQRLFTSPLTQLTQPSGATALQRYGVDPMAPKYADGGQVEVIPARRPGDPVVGTRGPIRVPNGGSPARDAAMRAVVQTGSVPRSTQTPPRPGPGAPRVTVERLRRAGEYAAGGEVMPQDGALSMMMAQHEGPGFVEGGEGGGQDDMVDAALSPGEYVFDADVVSALGDGSNDEGARRLDEMRERIRAHKRSAPPTEIPPRAKAPEAYLRSR